MLVNELGVARVRVIVRVRVRVCVRDRVSDR